ncbi:cupin domain-containing protein [Vibrio sp. FNV 38]|nr:cupin domain-containing protein [Vibrio sp. FNV 38]
MLNMDPSQSLIIDTLSQVWSASPKTGVWRKPLEREAAESGHVTSVVRYDPNSSFSTHEHPLGEEIIVLKGMFSDEDGDYPAGTYLRNPPGSNHTPYSHQGCELFVKLNQMDTLDQTAVRKQIIWDRVAKESASYCTQTNPIQRSQPILLYSHNNEAVYIVRLEPGQFIHPNDGFSRYEIFILKGTLQFKQQHLPTLTWMRLKFDQAQSLNATEHCVIWLKEAGR